MKGKKRRNRLLNQEIFESTTNEVILKEQLKFKGRFIEDKDLQNLSKILLNDKADFYTWMKMQHSFEYDLSSVYLSADMTEYYLSDSSSFDDLSRIFKEWIVVVCKLQKDRVQEIPQFECLLEYNIRMSNIREYLYF